MKNKIYIMNKLINIVIFYVALNVNCNMSKSIQSKSVEIEKAFVYDEYFPKGYTTASAYTHFDELEKQNVEKIELTEREINVIQNALSEANYKKHFQTKLGTQLIFAKIKFNTHKHFSRVVISMGEEKVIVIDLSYNDSWIIKNPKSIQLLKQILKQKFNKNNSI